MVDSHVMKVTQVESIAYPERIGVSNDAGCNFSLDHQNQSL
jgi:hypothetical protein